MCYSTLVSLHLDYAGSIWDPVHKDFIQRLNKIQTKAARIVKKNVKSEHKCVTQLIEGLGWGPLGTRRLHTT
jgi:hypothetical protein